MYNITDTDREFQALLTKEKLAEFEKSFEKNFFTQEGTLQLLSLGVRAATDLKFESSRVIWNTACFVNVLSYDLKIIIRSMIYAQREWEKRVFARQAAVLVYESLNDLFDLLGKGLKEAVKKLADCQAFEDQLKLIRSDLNSFKQSHFNALKEIRNVAAAHRDQDALKLVQTIYDISWMDSFSIFSSFDRIIIRLGGILEVLTSRVRELESLD